MTWTAATKLAELQRMLLLNERLYPRWIDEGSLAADVAERRLNLQREMVQDYRAQVAWERGEEMPGQPETLAELEAAIELAKEMVHIWAAAHSVAANKIKRAKERTP